MTFVCPYYIGLYKVQLRALEMAAQVRSCNQEIIMCAPIFRT